MYRKGQASWVNWIKKRIDNNLNFLAVAEGSTGIGKSWSMLSVAYMIDPTFEPRQIAFDFRRLMEILNSDWFKKKKTKVVLFDEVQISISNRKWQSLVNQLFNYLLSTFRHQNIILLFTSPYTDFLDLQARKLLHCIFECKGWNKKTRTSHLRPKLQQYNGKYKKFYEHSLFVLKDGKLFKLVNWHVHAPPKHLILPYEQSKVEFTSKLNQSILQQLTDMENKTTNKDKQQPKKPLTELQEQILELCEQGYNQLQIAEKLNKKQPQISLNMRYMRNKNYILNKKT